ncbi:MAG: ThuA domain-containing protein [Clostridia bacterium]
MQKIRVTIYCEAIDAEQVLAVYPNGLHEAIADVLREDARFEVRVATHIMEDFGLSGDVLDHTDVLFWWGHGHHAEVPDALVEDIWARVEGGMGIVVLHSGHYSKIFKRLTGRVCRSKWWENGDHERIFTVAPAHPIAQGVPQQFDLATEETYCEYFDVPTPDTLVFMSWFSGGAVLRSGLCYDCGAGHLFYFQPGHETCRSFYHPHIRTILRNAAVWAAGNGQTALTYGPHRAFEEEQK